MTKNNNNGGGAFNGNPTPPTSFPVGSNAQLRAAMQKYGISAGPGQNGNMGMQGVVSISNITSKDAQNLVNELGKAMKKQAELLEGMRKHGANSNHISIEEKVLKEQKEALEALKQQQLVVMGKQAGKFDPMLIDNLNKIQQALQNPAVQKALSNTTNPNPPPPGQPQGGQSSSGSNGGTNNPGGPPPPPNTPPTPPQGNGGGTPPIPPSPPSNNQNSSNNPSNNMAQFLKELQNLRVVTEEYRQKQKGRIQSSLTSDDLKNIKNSVTSVFTALLQDPSLTQDQKELALNRFNSAMGRFEGAYNMQAEATKRFVSMASGLVTTLQLGQLTQKMFISDPFQYQTMPAIGAVSSTGRMGEIVGAGLSASESWKLEQNQATFAAGGAIAGAGMLKGGKGGLIAGLAGATLAGIGLAGGGDNIRDILGQFFNTTTSSDVKRNIIAEKLVQPQTLADKGNMSKSLFTAFGGNPFGASNAAAGDNFTSMGNYINGAVSGLGGAKKYNTASGNAFIDRFWKQGMSGTGGRSALDLGMDADASGAFLANIAGNLRGKSMDQRIDLANHALKMGSAFGVDPNSFAETYRGMQAVGMRNLKEGYNESMAVFANDKGQVDQFSANVLQPALMKVTQSLAMRNVSLSADKLSENVNAFQKYLMTNLGNTELGRRAAADPSITGNILGGFAGASDNLINSTAGVFASYNILGFNPYDLIINKGDPKFFMDAMKNMVSRMGFTEDMFTYDKDGNPKIKSQYGDRITAAQQFTGSDFSTTMQLIGGIVKNGNLQGSELLDAIGMKLDEKGNVVSAKAGEIVGKQTDDPLIKAGAQMAKQATEMGKNVQALEETIGKIQTEVLKYVSNSKFLKDAEAGINEILKKARELLRDGSEKPGATPVPAKDLPKVFAGISMNSQSLHDLKKAQQSGNKSEMWKAIRALEEEAKKNGNTSFSQLIDRSSAVNTANAIFNSLGSNYTGPINPNQGGSNKEPFVLRNNTVETLLSRVVNAAPHNSVLRGNGQERNGLAFNSIRKAWELDINTSPTDTSMSVVNALQGVRGTLNNAELAFAKKNFGLTGDINQDIGGRGDEIIDRVIQKTKAKLGNAATNTTAGKSTMNLLSGIASMKKDDPLRNELIKLVGLSASNTNGVFNLSTLAVNGKGEAIDALGNRVADSLNAGYTGLDTSTSAKYGGNTTPGYGPSTKPAPSNSPKTKGTGSGQKPTRGQPKGIVSETTGAEQVIITVTGDGSVRAVQNYVNNQLAGISNPRRYT